MAVKHGQIPGQISLEKILQALQFGLQVRSLCCKGLVFCVHQNDLR